MALKIITGYTGTKHITPADDAGLHKSIFGTGDYVLHSGSQFAATVQSATEIRIADGELLMQGRHARNESGYESVTIANGSQGMYRNDLVVARYAKNASTSVESISLVAITGTATTGTATDPAFNTGNIDNGETRDFPLYRVKLNGITIESVEKLWETPVIPVEKGGTGKNTVAGIKSLLGLAKAAFVDLVTVALGGTGKTSHTSNAVLTGNGTSAVKNVATANGAFFATSANGAAKFGTLPVAQGGTGATNPENARANLDLGSVATRDTVPISMGGTGATSAEAARNALGLHDFASKTYVNEQSGNRAVIERLWSNPSPTAEFASGSVSLSSERCDMVMIVFRSSRTDATTHTAFARMGARGVVTRIGNIDNADNNLLFAKREFEFQGSGVIFGTCTFRQNTVNITNDYLIPIEIYGIDNIQY